jgi:hypothetical protein
MTVRATTVAGVVVVVVVVAATSPAAHADVGWSGAARIGVGAPLTGARAGSAAVDLGFRFDVLARPHELERSWGGGAFFDARTLGFQRHDVGGGAAVSSPTFYRLFAATLRVGAGYRWRSDAENGAVLMSTFSFGFRIPIKAHEEVVLGVYMDARMLPIAGTPSELTTGIEVDPFGIIAAIYERAQWQPQLAPASGDGR